MKKLYTIICASAFAFASLNANAVTHNVAVGANNLNLFSPTGFSANVGDEVVFTLASGIHSVVMGTVPAGAAPFNSGAMSTVGEMYHYPITVSGSYFYICGQHGSSMSGGFTVGFVGVADVATDLLTSVYPNPFTEKINVKYNGIESIEFFNVVGEKMKSVELTSPEGKLEVDFETLPAGIYFYRTYKDGIICETRKIVKAK